MTVRGHVSLPVCSLALLGTFVIGLTGVLPLLVFGDLCSPSEKSKHRLHLLLSFAVGSLLGDVFLHFLPEVWSSLLKSDSRIFNETGGSWILSGLLFFIFVDLVSSLSSSSINKPDSNGSTVEVLPSVPQSPRKHVCLRQKITAIGYCNLVANAVDNFTHGMAVGCSFCMGVKVGLLTVFAIFIHEVPHEFGDFALLLKCGFNERNVAKAQFLTATSGLIGAIIALLSSSTDLTGGCTLKILSFTSGGFIYVSLVTVVPDLMKETVLVETFKQLACVILGVTSVAAITFYCN